MTPKSKLLFVLVLTGMIGCERSNLDFGPNCQEPGSSFCGNYTIILDSLPIYGLECSENVEWLGFLYSKNQEEYAAIVSADDTLSVKIPAHVGTISRQVDPALSNKGDLYFSNALGDVFVLRSVIGEVEPFYLGSDIYQLSVDNCDDVLIGYNTFKNQYYRYSLLAKELVDSFSISGYSTVWPDRDCIATNCEVGVGYILLNRNERYELLEFDPNTGEAIDSIVTRISTSEYYSNIVFNNNKIYITTSTGLYEIDLLTGIDLPIYPFEPCPTRRFNALAFLGDKAFCSITAYKDLPGVCYTQEQQDLLYLSLNPYFEFDILLNIE